MGCVHPTPQKGPQNRGRRSSDAPLTQHEIQQRIEASARTQVFEIGGYSIKYAYVSQRGYYPDAPDKANQDTYFVAPKFEDDKALFGVFDGHGKEGHFCAHYTRDHLPVHMKDRLSKEPIEAALTSAHRITNEKLHLESTIDDSLSGTTAISILLHNKTMYISNVGDSRAIVGTVVNDRVVARALSNDQTPYRKDERERVKKCGARVMSMDQLEGIEPLHENWGDFELGEDIDEGGDPPRIWSPHGEYPGTAFTRSIGDAIAEELGVNADPEIMVRDLCPSDRFVIIASDGVFEFLTNQMVSDMVVAQSDPLEACKNVVAEAYELWLQYEIRTDDITMIALYVQCLDAAAEESKDNGTASHQASLSVESVAVEMTSRPVRRGFSRELRKTMVYDLPTEDDLPKHGHYKSETQFLLEATAQSIPKTPAELSRIGAAIRNNFMFSHLNDQQTELVMSVMERVTVGAGDCVIRQGAAGDKFYVVDQGTFHVRVARQGETSSDGGTIIHTYASTGGMHPCFGELSLMYGKPRAASVFAHTAGTLWALDRKTFRRVIVKPRQHRKDIIRTLRKVEVLKSLTIPQLQRLADIMGEVNYNEGEFVFRQGDEGDSFFVVQSGMCVLTVTEGGVEKILKRIKVNDYFGELSLINGERRAGSVVASTNVTLLVVSRRGFEEVLGSLTSIIEEDRKLRESMPTTPTFTTPITIDDLDKIGVALEDDIGSWVVCAYDSDTPNVTLRACVKSYVLERHMQKGMSNYLEILRAVTGSHIGQNCEIVPRLLSTYKLANGVCLLYKTVCVCDLATVLAHGPMTEEQIKFAAACVCVGLSILHRIGIVYRELSPEALFLNSNGNVVFVDYRLSKLGLDKTFTLCGTADYLAPEQVTYAGHSLQADFWALGVLLYELKCGVSPFHSDNETETYQMITNHVAGGITSNGIMSSELLDLINSLVHPDPSSRLGCVKGGHGIEDVKAHPFFRGVDWTGLENSSSAVMPLSSLASTQLNRVTSHGFDDAILKSEPPRSRALDESWCEGF